MAALVLLAGCGRKIPVTDNEQLLSGITPKNAGVITDTVVDVFEKPDVLSNRHTQVLYNQVVNIVEEQQVWMKITLLDGDEGWVKKKYVSRDYSSVTDWSIKNKIVVTAKTVYAYIGVSNKVKYKQLVMGTELYSFGKTKTGYDVLLPENKKGWIEEGGIIAIPINEPSIKKTSSNEFVQSVKKFEGTTYLLGGISRWGIDSSGLAYISSRINGVELGRSLAKMKNQGTTVDIKNIQPGDLIFLSNTNLKEDLNDLGIYMGDNRFFHASKTRGVVEESLDDEYYNSRICDIKRIF
jgi:hypothetical protein